jgi:predicted lipid-binding transport protein (Tim44 family)
MSYCPKCGNKVDETMAFCPRCGASLKGATSTQAPPAPPFPRRDEKSEKNEKQEKQEKNQHPEKGGEKQEKGEHGFVGYLIGGLVLITIGLFSVLNFSGYFTSGESWAVMLVIIGLIIIVGAIYVAFIARKRSPPTTLE